MAQNGANRVGMISAIIFAVPEGLLQVPKDVNDGAKFASRVVRENKIFGALYEPLSTLINSNNDLDSWSKLASCSPFRFKSHPYSFHLCGQINGLTITSMSSRFISSIFPKVSSVVSDSTTSGRVN
jgi:hypothetical protein